MFRATYTLFIISLLISVSISVKSLAKTAKESRELLGCLKDLVKIDKSFAKDFNEIKALYKPSSKKHLSKLKPKSLKQKRREKHRKKLIKQEETRSHLEDSGTEYLAVRSTTREQMHPDQHLIK